MNPTKSAIYITAQNYTFKELKALEREPLMYWKGDGKITFTI